MTFAILSLLGFGVLYVVGDRRASLLGFYLATALFVASSAKADPQPCIDTLAAAKYPKILRAIPNRFAVSCFARTFGDCLPVAMEEMRQGRSKMRINLMWSDTHTYGDRDLPFIRKEAARYNGLCKTYPERIELAPFTEHNIKDPSKYLLEVLKAAPECGKPVNSVWRGSFTTDPRFKNEVHGDHQSPPKTAIAWNYSHDGTNSVDTNFERVKRMRAGAEILCAWHPRLNLKWSMKDSTPRPQRKAIPDVRLVSSLVSLFTVKGETSIPKGWLVKSHAEKHDANDAKGDKLLIISPHRVMNKRGKIAPIVLKRDGKAVCKLPYYGPFDGGGYRYYAAKYGYECGRDLDVWLGGKKYGRINGAFRDGSFR